MKVVVYTRYGSPDVLQLKEVEKPVPETGNVVITVSHDEGTRQGEGGHSA